MRRSVTCPPRRGVRAHVFPPKGRKPLSFLSGAFSAVGADAVSHRISGRPSANKVDAGAKGNWCLQLEEKSEVKDGRGVTGKGVGELGHVMKLMFLTLHAGKESNQVTTNFQVGPLKKNIKATPTFRNSDAAVAERAPHLPLTNTLIQLPTQSVD